MPNGTLWLASGAPWVGTQVGTHVETHIRPTEVWRARNTCPIV